MTILGIDPGIATVGIGIVRYENNRFIPVYYSALTTPPTEKLPQRLRIIYSELCALIEKYKPDALAIEELFFGTNTKTAFAVGQGRGVAILSAVNSNVPVFEYTPLQVKQAVTGYGRAGKAQIQQMVKVLLGLPAIPKPDDVADALAIVICHAHSLNYNKKIKGLF